MADRVAAAYVVHTTPRSILLTRSAADDASDRPYNAVLAIATLITVVPMAVFFFAQRCFRPGVVISRIESRGLNGGAGPRVEPAAA